MHEWDFHYFPYSKLLDHKVSPHLVYNEIYRFCWVLIQINRYSHPSTLAKFYCNHGVLCGSHVVVKKLKNCQEKIHISLNFKRTWLSLQRFDWSFQNHVVKTLGLNRFFFLNLGFFCFYCFNILNSFLYRYEEINKLLNFNPFQPSHGQSIIV